MGAATDTTLTIFVAWIANAVVSHAVHLYLVVGYLVDQTALLRFILCKESGHSNRHMFTSGWEGPLF